MPRKQTGTRDCIPLTPEQRRELVERPLPVVRVVGGSKSWGGTSTIDWCGDKQGRAYTGFTAAGGLQWLKHLSE